MSLPHPNGSTREPIDIFLEALRAAQCDPREKHGKYTAKCPAHDDDRPSLDIRAGDDGKVLLTCRSHHCTAEQITGAIGLQSRDLFRSNGNGNGKHHTSKPKPESFKNDEEFRDFIAGWTFLFPSGPYVNAFARQGLNTDPYGAVDSKVTKWRDKQIFVVKPEGESEAEATAALCLERGAKEVLIWSVNEEYLYEGAPFALMLAMEKPWLGNEHVKRVEPPTRPKVGMRRAADIMEKHYSYLWKPRIPLGVLSSLAGDPKLGKSLVSIWLAARVSRGETGNPPASVILMSAEDDPAKTIVRRLRAAGADMAKVHILESVFLPDGNEAIPSLRADIERIEDAAVGLGDCRMISIDPISAYLGGTDDHRNSELRGILTPLSKMAERHDIAIPLISHLTKGSGTNGKYRVTGSIAYVGACRANFLFVRDRDDPTGRRVLMLDNGCNEGEPIPTIAYTVQDDGHGPYVKWESEPVDITTEQALSAETEARNPAHRPPGKILKAKAFLKEKLTGRDRKGCELIDEWVDMGEAKGTIFNAKNAMQDDGQLVVDDSRKPQIWHLVKTS